MRFNSRAHGARDRSDLEALSERVVSIHARTGRATARNHERKAKGESFNSRAHGARDARGAAHGGAPAGFNSRAHGARDFFQCLAVRIDTVSIHARTGRATQRRDFHEHQKNRFNSRAHGARDHHPEGARSGNG